MLYLLQYLYISLLTQPETTLSVGVTSDSLTGALPLLILTITIRLPNQTPLTTLYAWPYLSLLIYRLLNLDIIRITWSIDSRSAIGLVPAYIAHDMTVVIPIGKVVHVGAVAATA